MEMCVAVTEQLGTCDVIWGLHLLTCASSTDSTATTGQ